MIKFFLTGIIVSVFCTLFLIHNSFTSLVPPAKNTTLPDSNSRTKDEGKDASKNSNVNSPVKQHQQTEKTPDTKSTAGEKHNARTPEKEKEFSQQPPERLDKDILQEIKSPHGEVVIKKIRDEKSVTVLTTEDKRITGLQMPKGQAPATGESYIDNKSSKADTGIQLPNNQQRPVSTESYTPDLTTEPRY